MQQEGGALPELGEKNKVGLKLIRKTKKYGTFGVGGGDRCLLTLWVVSTFSYYSKIKQTRGRRSLVIYQHVLVTFFLCILKLFVPWVVLLSNFMESWFVPFYFKIYPVEGRALFGTK